MERYRNIFQLYAKQPEETVESALLGSLLRQSGHAVTESIVSSLINYHNKEYMNFEEFYELTQRAKQNEITHNDMLESFRAFDTEKTGFINVCQLKSILCEGSERLCEEEIEELLQILNPDSDGRINYECLVNKFI